MSTLLVVEVYVYNRAQGLFIYTNKDEENEIHLFLLKNEIYLIVMFLRHLILHTLTIGP